MDKREVKQELCKIIGKITVAVQMGKQENWAKIQLLGLDKREANWEVLGKQMFYDL